MFEICAEQFDLRGFVGELDLRHLIQFTAFGPDVEQPLDSVTHGLEALLVRFQGADDGSLRGGNRKLGFLATFEGHE